MEKKTNKKVTFKKFSLIEPIVCEPVIIEKKKRKKKITPSS